MDMEELGGGRQERHLSLKDNGTNSIPPSAPTSRSYETCDQEPPSLAYNAGYQQHIWPWSATHAESAPAYPDGFGASYSGPSFMGPDDVSRFHEHVRTQSFRPGFIALPEVEPMPASFDYGILEPIVEWCDTANYLMYEDSTSPPLSLVSTNDSSLASLNDEPPVSHTQEMPNGSVEINSHSRMDPVKRWLHDHPFDRYPTPKEKADLAAAAGLSSLQLGRRLTNLRKRERRTLDRLCNEPEAALQAFGSPDGGTQPFHGSTQTGCGHAHQGRKGKRVYSSRHSSAIREAVRGHSSHAASDSSGTTAKRFHCTMCLKPFKNSYLWRRHESGVHGFGSTRWICTLDSTVMTGAKCIFCSDIVYNMDHFDQHNVQICLAKDTAERVFDRKDLLKQHVQYVHLTSANDYTKKGFEPPDVWLETEDSFLPNPEGLWCGFCQLSFDTVARRMKHVAQHFQDGVDMVDWVRRLDFANSAMT